MEKIFLYLVLGMIFTLSKCDLQKQAIESFKSHPIDEFQSNYTVYATPSTYGHFYYAFCKILFSPTPDLNCKVTEEIPLSNTVSQKKTCNVNSTWTNNLSIVAWGEHRVLLVNEYGKDKIIVHAINMIDCEIHQIDFSSVESFQVYSTSDQEFDFLWTGNDPNHSCSKWLCRNTYNTNGVAIRENQIFSSKPSKVPGLNGFRTWMILLLGQQSETSYYYEWANENERFIYKVTPREVKKTKILKNVSFVTATENQELGICSWPEGFMKHVTCTRYDLEGDVNLNFTVSQEQLFHGHTFRRYVFLKLFNLRDGKLMPVVVNSELLNINGTEYGQIRSYSPQVFRPNGQYEQNLEMELHEDNVICSIGNFPGVRASDLQPIRVVEKDQEICIQSICHLKNGNSLNLNLKMDCAPKNFFIPNY